MRLAVFLLFAVASSATGKSKDDDCPKGQVRLLNNKCVKKAILPEVKRCAAPSPIRFGHTEVKLGGRMVSVWCEDGWTPAPDNHYAMCRLGRWDREIPRCVRPGCMELSVPEDRGVIATEDLDGALLRFSCRSPDLQELVGEAVLGCDGEFWNGTAPHCREKTLAVTEPDVVSTDQLVRVEDGGSSGSTISTPSVLLLATLTALIASR